MKPMNPTPGTDRELAELIDRWHLCNLDGDARARLVERLERDPAARGAFVEAATLEAMLHFEYPDAVAHFPEKPVSWFRQPAVWFAAASVALLAGAVVIYGNRGAGGDSTPVEVSRGAVDAGSQSQGTQFIESTPVARVSSMRDIVMAPGSLPVGEGALVPPGSIRLESGKVELTFFSGARVALEGPCDFELKSDFRATLVHGRLTTDVPPQATGFTIHTPSGQLRDLGTAFAVSVDRRGDADVHVLDGKVEAVPRGATSLVTLTGNQASRLTGGKLLPIHFLANGWPDRPDSRESPDFPASVHWSFDRFEQGRSMDAGGVHPLWLRGRNTAAGGQTNRLQQGVKGRALNFNGVDQFAESTYRGVSGNKPRSVAFWVRIPPDASYAYPNGIVSWGSHKQSRKWQVCWNNGDQGTVGAPRVEFGDGYLIGTTDLRDGLWHHLAAVYLGGTDSDVASHVKLYVDGRLETLSGRRSQFIRTDTKSPQAIAVTLGRWLGNWPGKEPFYFRGSLDEVFIFENALTPAQVAKLAANVSP
jgi:hypothetical protein